MPPKIDYFSKISQFFSEKKITNPLKKYSEKVVRWFAKQNDDINDFAKLYSMATVLLLGVMVWSSINAAKADFSVLYGNHFNIHKNMDAAWYYALFRAAFIQALIIIPGGVNAKLLLNWIWYKMEHRFLFVFLLIIMGFGFSWSYELSMQMKQAVRSESQLEVERKESDYNATLLQKQVKETELNREQGNLFKTDSIYIADAFARKLILEKANYKRVKDSLNRRAAKLFSQYKNDGIEWKLGRTKIINNQQKPALLRKHQYNLQQINSTLADSIYAVKQNIAGVISSKILLARADFNDLLTKKKEGIQTLQSDIEYNAFTRTYRSIMYNIISIIILFFSVEVYKRINANNLEPETGSKLDILVSKTGSKFDSKAAGGIGFKPSYMANKKPHSKTTKRKPKAKRPFESSKELDVSGIEIDTYSDHEIEQLITHGTIILKPEVEAQIREKKRKIGQYVWKLRNNYGKPETAKRNIKRFVKEIQDLQSKILE